MSCPEKTKRKCGHLKSTSLPQKLDCESISMRMRYSWLFTVNLRKYLNSGNFSISEGKLKFNREIKTLASRENAVFLLNSGPFGDGKK